LLITEKRLLHILHEMEYNLTCLAKELDPQKVGLDGIELDGELISFKYMQQKTAAIKSHIEWIRCEIEENKIKIE